jgi:lipopolysaccharide/colanic/teichoic acid biosynthesis glycosyltransferase
VAELERQIPFYRARLLAKPGLTGWAQIKFRYGGSPRDALVKLQYDLYYVKHRSLMLDVFIMARTVPVVLRMRGT